MHYNSAKKLNLYGSERQNYIYSAQSNDEKERFDTPSLSEAWRNAPYLHDGRASTIREVLVDFNKNGTHGKTGNLTDEELNCLLEYVLSL